METMFVSVVIPAHNAEVFLREAIESVLCQTHACFELILADDGSTDGTLAIIREYERRDRRIRVITHENWSTGETLNHAIAQARSEWIVRMDADDTMEPTRIERQIAFLSEHPDLAVTACLVIYTNEHGRVLGRSAPEFTTDEQVERVRSRGDIIGFHHPSVVMSKSFIQSIGGYRNIRPAQDIDLWNRVADAGGRVLVQPEYLMRYRIHSQQTTVQKARQTHQRLNWIRECSLHRRRGEPEPTFDAFLAAQAAQPLHKRLNEERKTLASVLYKQATFAYSIKRYWRAVLLTAASSGMDPLYAPQRVWRKMLRHLVVNRTYNRR